MKVGIAISNYKSNQEVIDLVNRINDEKWLIEGIMIVDSEGDGKILENLSDNVSKNILYHNFDYNLGSAGNLSKRLVLSSKLEWDFVLALNHDALLEKSTFEQLILYMGLDNIGALYPLRYYHAKGFYDFSGTKEVGPWRSFGPSKKPDKALIPHIWSSSNGALYNLKPVRSGIIPREEFWMGWEDYLYGLDLKKAGYQQYLVSNAVCDDNYEFEERKIGPIKIKMSAKPTWYHYYRTRNLWLISCYYHPSLKRILLVLVRTFIETFFICFGWEKTNRIEALKLQTLGFIHGIMNKNGKKQEI